MGCDPNLPPNLTPEHEMWNSIEPKMKECPECDGNGYTGRKYSKGQATCIVCDGEGEIQMTYDEIREEIETKKENQINL